MFFLLGISQFYVFSIFANYIFPQIFDAAASRANPTCDSSNFRRKSSFGKTWKKSPWFGRDHVARSSSGLKPLRRRAPRHPKTRHPGIQKQINVRYRKKYHKCEYALSHPGKQIAETCQSSG